MFKCVHQAHDKMLSTIIYIGQKLDIDENPLDSKDVLSGQPPEWSEILNQFIVGVELESEPVAKSTVEE